VVSPINYSNAEGTMISTFINRCRQSFKSTMATAAPHAKPAVETLESRSLLDANGFVRGLYATILNRASPTDSEVNGWVSQIQSGVSLQTVAAAFAGSSERFGNIVNDDYTAILGRSADQGGLNYWTQQMVNGMSQSQVQAAILATQEAFDHSFGSDQGFINTAFQTALLRQADDAGSNFYLNELANGMSRGDVALQIVNSHEAHLRDIDQLYLQMLGRNADTDAYNFFGNNLDNGGSQIDVASTVGASTEFQDTHGGPV